MKYYLRITVCILTCLFCVGCGSNVITKPKSIADNKDNISNIAEVESRYQRGLNGYIGKAGTQKVSSSILGSQDRCHYITICDKDRAFDFTVDVPENVYNQLNIGDDVVYDIRYTSTWTGCRASESYNSSGLRLDTVADVCAIYVDGKAIFLLSQYESKESVTYER